MGQRPHRRQWGSPWGCCRRCGGRVAAPRGPRSLATASGHTSPGPRGLIRTFQSQPYPHRLTACHLGVPFRIRILVCRFGLGCGIESG